MTKEKAPVTPAVRVLRAEGVAFTEHLYPYVEKGGTDNAARCLGVNEHQVIKTLVMEDDRRNPLIVLMHGDRQVSTRRIARAIAARSASPCTPETAQKHTGYQVGGTSPLGTRKPLPVYLEASIADLPRLYLNGGKRGFLVGLDPADLLQLLHPTPVHVAVGAEDDQG